jgi:hypothetical protein
MDTTQPGFWIAIGLGGSLVGALSAVQQFTQKSGPSMPFRPQPVVRDFCFGAFLTAVLYMFLPESMTSWISAGQSLVSSAAAKAAAVASSATASAPSSDIELQTGPARF